MKIKKLHKWNVSYSKAIELQKKLAGKLQFKPVKTPPKLIAGLDCALSTEGQRIIACVILLRWPDLEIIETKQAVRKLSFPYIPGLLSFREAPACIAAVEKLKHTPDIFLIDGQGIAHPRRLGLATHLGLFFDKPTIGCAKSRLTGCFEEPPLQKGSYTLLKNEKYAKCQTSHEPRITNHEIIGAVVRTRTNVKPLFVSVGHKCSLKDAVKITLSCAIKYRLPEPTRLAHQLVGKLKLQT